jgi:hypothetical protein
MSKRKSITKKSIRNITRRILFLLAILSNTLMENVKSNPLPLSGMFQHQLRLNMVPTTMETSANLFQLALHTNARMNLLLLLIASQQTMELMVGNTKETPTMFKRILSQLAILSNMLMENVKRKL